MREKWQQEDQNLMGKRLFYVLSQFLMYIYFRYEKRTKM